MRGNVLHFNGGQFFIGGQVAERTETPRLFAQRIFKHIAYGACVAEVGGSQPGCAAL